VIDATGLDTKQVGTKTVYDQVRLLTPNSSAGGINHYDDLYLSTGSGCTFKGDIAIGPTYTDVLLENFTSVTDWGAGISSVAGGRTGNAGQVSGSNTAAYTIPAPNESAVLTVGFAYKVNTLAAARTFLTLASDSGVANHTTFQVNTDGSLVARLGSAVGTALGTTAAGLITINTWYYLEAQVVLHDTTGTLKLRLNGTTVLDLAGIDTKFGGTKTVFDTVRLAGGGSGATSNFDDLYITTGPGAPFKGDITVP
jgi:hypothetical protein